MITDDGEVYGLPDVEVAAAALAAPEAVARLRLAKRLG
jgi:hypothetical protein